MDRLEKQEFIDRAHKKFKEAGIALIVHNKGLTVAEMSELRGKIREAGGEFKVGKNRLIKLALKDTTYESIGDLFTGPTGVATSDEPVGVAKGVVEFAKKNDRLVVIGGAYGEQTLDVTAIEALAKLPSLEELRAKIVGMLQTPATRIACILQAPGSGVARVISAKSQQGE